MLAKHNTFALVGIEAVPVQVEVDASAGLPKTILVGLPEAAVRESQHRVERALANLGYDRHTGRTVINLAPADLPKAAGAFDLPIALGLLVATGQLLPEHLKDYAHQHGVFKCIPQHLPGLLQIIIQQSSSGWEFELRREAGFIHAGA